MRRHFYSFHIPFSLLCFLAIFILAGLFWGCKSQPLPTEEAPTPLPSFGLAFKGIEANDPAHLSLFFALEAENPVPAGSLAKIISWQVEIDGQNAGTAFSFDYPQGDFPLGDSIPFKLDMDIEVLVAMGLAPRDEYSVTLITELDYSQPPLQPTRFEVRSSAVFPGVRPPVFNITEIAILQAELINTRFRVGLRIDNPNPFPLELSAFSYRLYGNNMFWAEGIERNVLRVNAESSLSGNIFLIMNFIDMDRNLLDQIIRLQDVNYRFTGEVLVGTGVEYLPTFRDGFNLSGFSRVLER
jgi:LEA14-like dessication related protein